MRVRAHFSIWVTCGIEFVVHELLNAALVYGIYYAMYKTCASWWNCFAVDRRRSSAFSTQDGFVIDDGTVVPVTPMSTLVQQSMLMAAPQQLDGDLALQPPKIVHFNRYLSLPAGTGAQQNKARMILSFCSLLTIQRNCS